MLFGDAVIDLQSRVKFSKSMHLWIYLIHKEFSQQTVQTGYEMYRT